MRPFFAPERESGTDPTFRGTPTSLCSLLNLASFAEINAFELCPCYCAYQEFIPHCCWGVVYCMNVPPFLTVKTWDGGGAGRTGVKGGKQETSVILSTIKI